MKKAVAISNVSGEHGGAIAKALAGCHHVLLFGCNAQQLQQLADDIKKSNSQAEIEYSGCPLEASWEADVIILSEVSEEEIVEKIKPVATQKLVIDLATGATRDIQQLLPYSKIIHLQNFSTPEIIEKIQSILQTA